MSLASFFFAEAGQLRVSDLVELSGPEGHHAATVRRITAGESITLTDGAGSSAVCEVTRAEKKTLRLIVRDHLVRPAELPKLTVVQAIPKGHRGELAVEMLTEVGVDVIVPWAAERSVAVWKGDRAAKSLQKWRDSAREAAKQARRDWFPEVTELASTATVAELLAAASVRVVLDEAASGPLANVPVPGRGEIVIVVGPEGGITPEELAVFGATGADALRMGSSVLRSSTAGVAASAALLARTPRWR